MIHVKVVVCWVTGKIVTHHLSQNQALERSPPPRNRGLFGSRPDMRVDVSANKRFQFLGTHPRESFLQVRLGREFNFFLEQGLTIVGGGEIRTHDLRPVSCRWCYLFKVLRSLLTYVLVRCFNKSPDQTKPDANLQ